MKTVIAIYKQDKLDDVIISDDDVKVQKTYLKLLEDKTDFYIISLQELGKAIKDYSNTDNFVMGEEK